ncbi:hypothetical protein SK128_014855 [Halocaridina rubra]|uniref:Uncharacterized protein n=1 Tax=Halocaridina rubra TaxID=373956 RepID=A0AAN9AEK1_HALRR
MRIIFCLLLNSFAVNYCVYTLSINKNKYTTTTELKTESENISKLNLHNIGRYGLAHNINDTQRFPVKWRKIDEEWSLHPLNVTALEIREDDEKRYFHIRVVVTKHRVAVFRDDAMRNIPAKPCGHNVAHAVN